MHLLILFNFRSSEIGINHVVNFVRNVEDYLGIEYMEEIDDNEVRRWKSKLQSVQHRMPQVKGFFIHILNAISFSC